MCLVHAGYFSYPLSFNHLQLIERTQEGKWLSQGQKIRCRLGLNPDPSWSPTHALIAALHSLHLKARKLWIKESPKHTWRAAAFVMFSFLNAWRRACFLYSIRMSRIWGQHHRFYLATNRVRSTVEDNGWHWVPRGISHTGKGRSISHTFRLLRSNWNAGGDGATSVQRRGNEKLPKQIKKKRE